jgi:3-oxoacyl-[acyl-carrier-protein] synthase-3
MRFDNIAILGLECVDAPHVIPSSEIVRRLAPTFDRLGMRHNLLDEVAGIRERRYWDEGVKPSDAATLAAEKVIAAVEIERRQIGVLVNSSVCRDYLEPSTACIVHGNLELSPECLNYDLGNACLAFLNAMEMVSSMLEKGDIDYAMIVDGESSRTVIEATVDRLLKPEATVEQVRGQFAALTLGSGSVAMILGRADENSECTHRYLGGVNLAATRHRHMCRGQMDWMETDTRGLLEAGVELAGKTWAMAQQQMGWVADELDEIVLHQVSQVHTASLIQALGLDPRKALLTFPEFGNVGPASVPMTLRKAIMEGRVKDGDRCALMGIGSGLNCTYAEVVW